MNMSTEATPASTRHTDLVVSQMRSLGLTAPLQLDTGTIAKKSKQPSRAEYSQLVAALQKRLKQAESESVALRKREKQLSKRCRVQSKLIRHLRGQVGDQSKQIAALEKNVALPVDKYRQEPRSNRARVVSVNDALLRISGVELPDKTNIVPRGIVSQEFGAIDLEDLQDTEDRSAVSATLGHVGAELKGMAVQVALTVHEQIKTRVENFNADPYKLLVKKGIKHCQSAALELQHGFKAKLSCPDGSVCKAKQK